MKEFMECSLLSIELCDLRFSPELAPVCLGSCHKMYINRRFDVVNITNKHRCFSSFFIKRTTPVEHTKIVRN